MKFVRLCQESPLMLNVTFRLQYCKSSSGDEVYYSRVAICSMLVRCYCGIQILMIIPVVRWFSLIGPHKSVQVLFDPYHPLGSVNLALCLLWLLRSFLFIFLLFTLRTFLERILGFQLALTTMS